MSFGVVEGKESEERGIRPPTAFRVFFNMLVDYVTHSDNHTKGITYCFQLRLIFFSYFSFIYVYILVFPCKAVAVKMYQ